MNKALTFGKFQGFTPLELAKAGEAGRGYLRWGAEHLKSPQWRQAFEDALKADVEVDVGLATRVMVRDCPDIDTEEAEYIVREEIAQAAEVEAMLEAVEARQAEVVAHWASIMKVEPAKLRALAKRYEFTDLYQLPQERFSSVEAHQNFIKFMQAWLHAYDE